MRTTSSVLTCRSVMDVKYSATSVGIVLSGCHDCDGEGDGKCSVPTNKDLNFAFSWRLVPILVVGYMAFRTSITFQLDSDYGHFSGSISFWGALAFMTVNFLLVSILYGERQSACTFAYHLMSILRKQPTSSSGHFLLAGISSISAGYYLLATVIADQSSRNSIALESQLCKRAAMGCIPHDRVMICYLIPIIVQLSLQNSAIEIAICQWLTATIFVTISIVHVQGWQQLWTLLYSTLFLFISFKIDSYIKKSSVLREKTDNEQLHMNMRSVSSCDSAVGQGPVVDLKPDIPPLFVKPLCHSRVTSSLTKERLLRASNSQDSVASSSPDSVCSTRIYCSRMLSVSSSNNVTPTAGPSSDVLWRESPMNRGRERGQTPKDDSVRPCPYPVSEKKEQYKFPKVEVLFDDQLAQDAPGERESACQKFSSISFSEVSGGTGTGSISPKSSTSTSVISASLSRSRSRSVSRCSLQLHLQQSKSLDAFSYETHSTASPPRSILPPGGLSECNSSLRCEATTHQRPLEAALSLPVSELGAFDLYFNRGSSWDLNKNNSGEYNLAGDSMTVSERSSIVCCKGSCSRSSNLCDGSLTPVYNGGNSFSHTVPLPDVNMMEDLAQTKWADAQNRPIHPIPMTPLQMYSAMPICSDAYTALTEYSRVEGDNPRILDLLQSAHFTESAPISVPIPQRWTPKSGPLHLHTPHLCEYPKNYYLLPSASSDKTVTRSIRQNESSIAGWRSYSTSACSSHPEDAISTTSSSAVQIQILDSSRSRSLREDTSAWTGSRHHEVGTIVLGNANIESGRSPLQTQPDGKGSQAPSASQAAFTRSLVATLIGGFQSLSREGRTETQQLHRPCAPSRLTSPMRYDHYNSQNCATKTTSMYIGQMKCSTACGGRSTGKLSQFSRNLISAFKDDVGTVLRVSDILLSSYTSDLTLNTDVRVEGDILKSFDLFRENQLDALSLNLNATRILMVKASMSLCLAIDNITMMKNLRHSLDH